MLLEHCPEADRAVAVEIAGEAIELGERLLGRHRVDVEKDIVDADALGDFLGLELVGDRQHRRADAKRHDHHVHARRHDEIEFLGDRHQLFRRMERRIDGDVLGDFGRQARDDQVCRLRIVMGIFRYALAGRNEGDLLSLVTHQLRRDVAHRVDIAPHPAVAALDVVPVPHRYADAARRCRPADRQERLDPLHIGERKDRIGHYVALRRIVDEIEHMVARTNVAQQDQRTAGEDRRQVPAVVGLREGTERLREEDRLLAKHLGELELVDAPFERIVFDEIGAAGGDHHIGVLIERQALAVRVAEETPVEIVAASEVTQGLEHRLVIDLLQGILDGIVIVFVLEDRFRRQFPEFDVRILFLRIEPRRDFRLTVEHQEFQLFFRHRFQDMPDREQNGRIACVQAYGILDYNFHGPSSPCVKPCRHGRNVAGLPLGRGVVRIPRTTRNSLLSRSFGEFMAVRRCGVYSPPHPGGTDVTPLRRMPPFDFRVA
ncbi:hypothetical protein AOX55_00006428 (plasmid) [Sinorhizobium fredii CCBAU 25509]|nr:hypothetical protein AOX55_00006428 [Sinorhizobium fredii CCBAU 25509]